MSIALVPTVSVAAPGTLFVNFDGADLSSGTVDDARRDETAISELVGRVEAFSSDAAQRRAVTEAVKTDFESFGMRVVDQRPASGDYIMAIVTPTNPFGNGVTGAAVNDCDDDSGPNDIVFAFFAGPGDTALDVATTISQEVGHSIGLEHVDDAADVMYPIAAGADAYFNDNCVDLSGPAACPGQHRTFCEDTDQQNSFAELIEAFGTAQDDGEAPWVEVASPGDDPVIAGEDVDITVDAEDDTFIDRVELWEGGDMVGEDRAPPYVFTVSDIDEGEYEIYAVAIDAAGNRGTSDTIELVATAPWIPGPSGAPGFPGTRRGGEQAGCSVTGGAPPPVHHPGWLAILVVALVRRRRATGSRGA